MAVYQLTSDPKPSTRVHGWLYAYYNKPTPAGGECIALIAPAIADIARRGLAFDESCITFDDALRASVLNLDFAEPQRLDGPSLPPDPEAGWGDPDRLPASPPEQHQAPVPQPQQAGVRPPAQRRRAAEAIASMGSQIPADFLKINLEINKAFLMQYALLSSIPDARRADVAQKLAVTAAIPYYRQKGIELTDDDVKGMTAY